MSVEPWESEAEFKTRYGPFRLLAFQFPSRRTHAALVKGDLSGVVRAIALSRATMRNIRQNLFLAFVYNSVCIPVAAGVLYPLFGILLSPMLAALAMSLSSVSVIANALRLRRVRL